MKLERDIYSEPAFAAEAGKLESENQAQDGRDDIDNYRMMHVR